MADLTDNKNNQNHVVGVDDGTECIELVNRHGETIGKFTFRPTDTGIVDRYEKIKNDLGQITAPIEALHEKHGSNDDEGDEGDEEFLSALRDARQRLFEALDFLFDAPVSRECFGRMDPFSPVGGKFYCENVIEALGKFIEGRFNVQTTAVNNRIGKYTAGMKRGRN